MRRDVEDEQTIRRYLLDDLPPQERRRLEERLLDDDDDFFEQLQLAEAELADDYVTGEVSEDDRARFDEAFLFSPERHEQLRFAELLREHFAAKPLEKTVAGEARTRPSWLRKFTLLLGLDSPAVSFALACGLILAVSLAAWFGFRASQLSGRLEQLQAQQQPAPSADPDALARLQRQLEEERARRESAAQERAREQDMRARLEQELSRLKAGGQGETAAVKPTPERGVERPARPAQPAPGGRVLAVTLLSGGVRESGETKTERLTPAVVTVRLRLDIGAGDYRSYRATLQDAEEKSLLSSGALPLQSGRGSRAVVFDVPARLFGNGGDFQVVLNGVTREGAVEEIDRYSFRTVRD